MNEKLREKLILNGRRLNGLEQRKRLSTLIPTISPDLRAALSNAPTHFGEEEIRFDGIIPSPIGSICVDEAPVLPSPNAEYRDTDCWQSVLETIARFECQDCVPAILKFGDCLPSWKINLSHCWLNGGVPLKKQQPQHHANRNPQLELDQNETSDAQK